MTNSTPTSSANAAGGAADQRLLEMPAACRESEPTWVADDLHLLRLVCQLTDYEVAGAPGDDCIVTGHLTRSAASEAAPGMPTA